MSSRRSGTGCDRRFRVAVLGRVHSTTNLSHRPGSLVHSSPLLEWHNPLISAKTGIHITLFREFYCHSPLAKPHDAPITWVSINVLRALQTTSKITLSLSKAAAPIPSRPVRKPTVGRNGTKWDRNLNFLSHRHPGKAPQSCGTPSTTRIEASNGTEWENLGRHGTENFHFRPTVARDRPCAAPAWRPERLRRAKSRQPLRHRDVQ